MRPAPRPAAGRRRRRASAIAALSLGLGAPPALYFITRPHLHSDAAALAMAAAVPTAVTAVVAAWRRQVRLLGALEVVGLGAALTATALTGSSLPLKLGRPVATGAVGLALLASVAVRRPLLLPILRVLARDDDARRGWLERAAATTTTRRALTVVTAVLGAGFLVEAVATVIAALSLPTGAFLVVSRLIRLGVIGVAAAVILARLRWRRTGGRGDERGAGRAGRRGGDRTARFGPMRGRIGWGRPQTWQARLIVAALIAAVLVLRYLVHVPLAGR